MNLTLKLERKIMSDLNLYEIADRLVMLRNSFSHFVNSKVKKDSRDEMLFYIFELNKEIRSIQKLYRYIDYDKMIKENPSVIDDDR